MTEKQKIAVALGVLVLVIAFAFIYRQFSLQISMVESEPSVVTSPTLSPSARPLGNVAIPELSPTPTTPDSIADDILKNDADTSAFDIEADGEANAAQENSQTIDDITNSYDEQQI